MKINRIFRKKIIMVLVLAVVLVPFTAFSALAEDDAQEIQALTPHREEYGNAVGEVITLADGKTVCQNYQYGYVYAEKTADGRYSNKRDVGGMNINAEGVRSFVDMQSFILGRGADFDVQGVWTKLNTKYDKNIAYDANHAISKIYDEYKNLCDKGYNCGIPTDNLSVWDGSVIKLDFYDGDSEYGFESPRVHVTTIAFSFLKDQAYMISGEFFNFYKEAKAGSLMEPISDPFEYTLEGMKGTAQAFAQGLLFLPEHGDLLVRAGVRYNEDSEEFESLEMDFEELTRTEINQSAIDASPYYGGKNLTVLDIQQKFHDKFYDLIDDGFIPGIPDHEGILYWDSRYLKQAFVGSEGTGNAWGRTNMMLMLNPDDLNVYMIYGEILNIVDESAQGLGNAEKLGYPLGDQKTKEVDGLTYYYQDFSEGTIYSIESVPQLTRFIKGKTFDQIIEAKGAQKPNNPSFYYSFQSWFTTLFETIGRWFRSIFGK